MNKKNYTRHDFQIQNKRNFRLECSLWEAKATPSSFCVVYLHGNSSSRFESVQLFKYFSKFDISLCSFDFSGCGLSEGEYISLGWHEKDDVDYVVKYLLKERNIKKIALWGRSMGSSAAIIYSSIIKEGSICCLVFDSPFCSLKILSEDIARRNSKAPKCIMRLIWIFLKRKIMKKNQFNINDIAPINHIQNIKVPAFFISAKSDKIIDPVQMNRIYNEYPNKKCIEYVEGDHNSPRPEPTLMKCVMFINAIFLKNEFTEADLILAPLEQKLNGEAFSVPQKKAPIIMIQPKKVASDEKMENMELSEFDKK